MEWRSRRAKLGRRWRARPLLALEVTLVLAGVAALASAASFLDPRQYTLHIGQRAIEAHGARALGLRADLVDVAGADKWGIGWYLAKAPLRLANRASLWPGRCAEVPEPEMRWVSLAGDRGWSGIPLLPSEAVRVVEVSDEGAVAEVLDGHFSGTRVSLHGGRDLQPCSPARDAWAARVARANALPVETPTL